MHLNDHFAGIEIVQRQLDETPGGFAVFFKDAVGAEKGHWFRETGRFVQR